MLLAAPLAAKALQAPSLRRIGYLGSSSPSLEPSYVEAFRQQLRDLGYIEGQHIAIEYRWAEGRDERLPGLAAELVRLDPVVIVTTGTPGKRALSCRTSSAEMLAASEHPAFLAGKSTVLVGFSILAVSAMKRTPQKTMRLALVCEHSFESMYESPI